MSEVERKRIVITKEDLRDPKIDEIIETERSYGPRTPEPVAEKRRFNILYASWFYLMLAGAIGAFAAWALIEPHFNDEITFTGRIERIEPGAVPASGVYMTKGKIWGRIRVANTDVYLNDPLTRFADQEGKLLEPASVGTLHEGQVVRVQGQAISVEGAGPYGASSLTFFFADVVWHQPDNT
ncbi:MAG: hypothetical protein LC731_03405, partial [Acidobacteria bacterium]|nr:hypothetical protein [Acidobacteriota bacterium]